MQLKKRKLPEKDEKYDILLFSDPHIAERKEFATEENGLNSRLNEGLQILDGIVNLVEKYKINVVISAGDAFELKDRIPTHIQLEFKKRIEELGKHDFVWLVGNHDFRLTKEYNNMDIFDRNVRVISQPQSIDRILFIPFMKDTTKFLNILSEKHKNHKLIICHQEFPGALYTEENNDYNWQEIAKKVKIFSGHLHKSFNYKGVQYIGSPYQVDFGEEGEDKYVWLLNSETLATKKIKMNGPKFITTRNLGDTVALDQINGNYVKVKGELDEVGYKNYDRNKVKETLLKAGAKFVTFDIKKKKTIIRDKTFVENKNDGEIIHKFVDKSDTKIDKNKLIQKGNALLDQTNI